MSIERFHRSVEKGAKEKPSVFLAKVIDARFHLIRKLGITLESERELALMHIQLRVLRHRSFEVRKFLRSPLIAINPGLQYSDAVSRKAEQRDRLKDRLDQLTEAIDERQKAMYEANPGTIRPPTIERAINIFMSGGDSYVARNMGTKFFRRRTEVRKWETEWGTELSATQ